MKVYVHRFFLDNTISNLLERSRCYGALSNLYASFEKVSVHFVDLGLREMNIYCADEWLSTVTV